MTPRKPVRQRSNRPDLGIDRINKHLTAVTPTIEAGWWALLDKLKATGWPSSTPEGDRKPGATPQRSTSYADPTGTTATGEASRLQADLEALQDHRHIVETSLAAMLRITTRHAPEHITTEPECTTKGCTNTVERRHSGKGFVNCELISNEWTPKPNTKPVCRPCRDAATIATKRAERAARSHARTAQ